MSAFIQKRFLQEPMLRSAAFRYGFLALILVLLAMSLSLAIFSEPSRHGRYFGVIVPLMLLCNHLAFQFRWSRTTMIILRVAAYVWCLFGLAMMAYLICTR